jgi:hypothetical protein
MKKYLKYKKTPVTGKKANSSPGQQGFSSLTGKTYAALPGRMISGSSFKYQFLASNTKSMAPA